MGDNSSAIRAVAAVSLDLVTDFVVLCDEGALGSAADRLGVSRHTLARRIDRLEAELGVRLMVRSRRVVQLTAAGTVLLEQARPIIAALDVAVQAVRRAQAPESLAIAVTTAVPGEYDGRVGAWLAANGFPGTVERRPGARALELLRGKRRDFVLMLGRSVDPRSEIVAYEPAVAVFPADHPAAARRSIRVGDLADLPVALSDTTDEAQRRERVERLHGDPDLPYLVVPVIGTIAQGLLHAARNMRAAAVVTERAIATADTTGLVARPLDPPLMIPVTLVPRDGLEATLVRSLADYLLGLPG
jgi:DNA-binding transcriptional LysR family regulator